MQKRLIFWKLWFIISPVIILTEVNKMVTKDMTINEICKVNQNIIAILLNAGMHCVGCPSAQGETLEEAAMVHGLDADQLVNQINAYLGE